jgi:hypothetical protein
VGGILAFAVVKVLYTGVIQAQAADIIVPGPRGLDDP